MYRIKCDTYDMAKEDKIESLEDERSGRMSVEPLTMPDSGVSRMQEDINGIMVQAFSVPAEMLEPERPMRLSDFGSRGLVSDAADALGKSMSDMISSMFLSDARFGEALPYGENTVFKEIRKTLIDKRPMGGISDFLETERLRNV